jgi:hypothetical protein
MKYEAMLSGITENKKERKALPGDSKEMTAIESKTDNTQRSFGLTDLWFIQKRSRSGASMRRRG